MIDKALPDDAWVQCPDRAGRPNLIRASTATANPKTRMVVPPHRFHAGHESVTEEKLRLVNDAKPVYSPATTGPDGTMDRRELAFAVETK